MINTSLVTFNGETVERYKNQVRVLSHKPRLLLQWGHWVCVSHNARGDGGYGNLSSAGACMAYNAWRIAQNRFNRGAPYRNPGAVAPSRHAWDDL